jgi:hypothetical protein
MILEVYRVRSLFIAMLAYNFYFWVLVTHYHSPKLRDGHKK